MSLIGEPKPGEILFSSPIHHADTHSAHVGTRRAVTHVRLDADWISEGVPFPSYPTLSKLDPTPIL